MKFIAANLKSIVLILLIWFTPFYLSWMAASAFAHSLHETYYLTLLVQVTAFLMMSTVWAIHIGPRVVLWIGFKWTKAKVTQTINSFTNKKH